MKKTILVITIMMFLLGSSVIVIAEDREPQIVSDGWFLGGNDASVDDYDSEDKKEIEPAPQPVLDLLLSFGIFIFSIALISLIVLFTISIKRYGNLIALEKLKVDKNISHNLVKKLVYKIQ